MCAVRQSGGVRNWVTDRSEVEMRRVRSHRDAIAVLAGLVLPVAVAAVLVPFRASFANTASALILVAVVVAVASNGNRSAGFIAAVSASVWFDFFLTKPYERFAITQRADIETAVSLFVVGIAVTELAARNRHHHSVANEESDYVGVIYRLAEMAAAGAPAEQVLASASDELIELLHLRSCRYEPQLPSRRAGQIEHDGHVYLGAVRWGAEHMGLPGKELELLVHARGQVVGGFVLQPTPAWPVSRERRLVAVAIADQVGSVLAPELRSA
jgi:K+-sensing histidine kinase KdpD